MNGPTHIQGHTLDLVLTHGLSAYDQELNDHVISDHKPVLFNIPVSCCSVNPVKSLQCFRSFSSTTSTEFVVMFNEVCKVSDSVLQDRVLRSTCTGCIQPVKRC